MPPNYTVMGRVTSVVGRHFPRHIITGLNSFRFVWFSYDIVERTAVWSWEGLDHQARYIGTKRCSGTCLLSTDSRMGLTCGNSVCAEQNSSEMLREASSLSEPFWSITLGARTIATNEAGKGVSCILVRYEVPGWFGYLTVTGSIFWAKVVDKFQASFISFTHHPYLVRVKEA